MRPQYAYLPGLKNERIRAGLTQRALAGAVKISNQSMSRYDQCLYRCPIKVRDALSKALGVSEDVLRSEPTDIAQWPGMANKSGLAKIGFSHLWTEHAPRADETVENENRRAYRESKKKPIRCQHCGTRLSAYNRGNVFCYRHTSPDSRSVAS